MRWSTRTATGSWFSSSVPGSRLLLPRISQRSGDLSTGSLRKVAEGAQTVDLARIKF